MPNALINRLTNLTEEIRVIREHRRRLVENAADALRQSRPDTFLGRQHYDFVPLPENVTRAEARKPIPPRR